MIIYLKHQDIGQRADLQEDILKALSEREAQVRAETLRDDKDLTLAYMTGFSNGKAEEREKAKGLVEALTAIKAAPSATNHKPGQSYEADAAQIAYQWAANVADTALATYNDNRKG